MQFSKKDIEQIQAKGLTTERVLHQIEILKRKNQFVELARPATINHGINLIDPHEAQQLVAYYQSEKDKYKLVKFVPASGAATRMFKFLFDFLENYKPDKQTVNAFINSRKDKDLLLFFVGLEKFSFYNSVLTYIKQVMHQNIATIDADTLLNNALLDGSLPNDFVEEVADSISYDGGEGF